MAHIPWSEFLRMWKLKPMASSDCVVIKGKEILLVKRAFPPFRGHWCLPGGIMDVGETIEQTALREVFEETGARTKIISLVGLYSGPDRDPRGTTLTACFLAKFIRFSGKPDKESMEVKFFPLNKLPKIAFDHGKMIKDALRLLRKKKSK